MDMNKKWVYLVLFVITLLSLFYDKHAAMTIAQNRLSILNDIALWFTNLLTIIIIFLLMTTLFLWEENKRKWIIPLWASVSVSAAVTIILKFLTQRTRPFEALALPLVQGADYTFNTMWNTSFPSLHTAAVFSLVPILDKEFPKLKWFWITLALLISSSRVYLGVHYLSDALAACLIGLLVGHGIILLEKRYFSKWKKKKN